ncbi:MAG: DUF6351 family protein [Rhodocyclaceae bacterium]
MTTRPRLSPSPPSDSTLPSLPDGPQQTRPPPRHGWPRKAIVATLALTGLVAAYLYLSHEPVAPVVVGLPERQTAANDTADAEDNGLQLPTAAEAPPPLDDFPYPIPVGGLGPVHALSEPAAQYPFLCGSERSGLGQPIVDNTLGHGIPVYREAADGTPTSEVAGYSRDCLVATRIDHFYMPVDGDELLPWHPGVEDVAMLTRDGHNLPFIVRLERGTINRFLYAIAVLTDPAEDAEAPDGRYWNRRLVYHFAGGVGIGRRQGRLSEHRVLGRDNIELLARGYAIATSTGNHTTNHYNMRLAGDTALRVKRQFVARYGQPDYTVGLGGSGGGLQQFLFGEHLPGLLDAAVPQYAYPDMVTQTIHALDCELLEHYFDVVAADNPIWADFEVRRAVQGLNALAGADNRYAPLYPANLALNGRWPRLPRGASECVQGWRGLTPLVLNPRFTPHAAHYAAEVHAQVNWTYWDDLVAIYGRDATGHARRTWDNVGVQYGLQALRAGRISPADFLDLNLRIGGWKPAADLRPETIWQPFGRKLPLWFSLWSAHNMTRADGDLPAARSRGDADAISAAWRSGQVFGGHIDIPVIEVRHYLEPALNMHHLSASFATRLRMQRAMGHAGNHALWVAHPDHDPTLRALELIDDWLAALRAAQGDDAPGRATSARDTAASRPTAAADACFDASGALIAQGDAVWDGDWNGRLPGACSRVYPSYGTSRSAAGASLTGDLFQCPQITVDAALAAGLYTPVDMAPYRDPLLRAFPDGVCDYRNDDVHGDLEAPPTPD